MLSDLIKSREKSIEKLNVRIAEFESLISKVPVGAPRAALEAQQRIAKDRRARLLADVAAFHAAEASLQPTLPGVDAPVKRK